jgi:creatinine amidohydrolase/Fe(II)-dependent formamide hydrolase-like protein
MSEVRITHLHPRELRERRDACPVAWIPVGTIEWHGKHLPLGVDGIIAEELCLKGAREIGGVAFPPAYYGDHRGIIVEAIASPGAWGELTFDHREECCRELGVSVAGAAANAVRDHELIGWVPDKHVELIERSFWMARAYGFSRIVVLPCHGGTQASAEAAVERFNARQSACRAIYAIPAYRGDDTVGHAGTRETSTMMFVLPGSARLERLETDKPDEPTGVHADGGHPKLASAERGRRTAEGFVARCRDELGEIPPPLVLSDPDEDGVRADWAERVRAGALSS